MKTNERARQIIKSCESLRLQSYLCPAGQWTIGWGHTTGVKPGQTITEAQAEEFFRQDVEQKERALDGLLSVRLNDNQYSALVSLVFNIGQGHFADSTLRKVINADPNDREQITYQWKRWNKSGGKVLPGLTIRRQMELDLYFTPDEPGGPGGTEGTTNSNKLK